MKDSELQTNVMTRSRSAAPPWISAVLACERQRRAGGAGTARGAGRDRGSARWTRDGHDSRGMRSDRRCPHGHGGALAPIQECAQSVPQRAERDYSGTLADALSSKPVRSHFSRVSRKTLNLT